VESNWVHSALRPLIGLLCQPRVLMMMEKLVESLAGKPKYSEKTCPSAALSNTNPTCCPDANPGRRCGKPASNRLSYGTAKVHHIAEDINDTKHTLTRNLSLCELPKHQIHGSLRYFNLEVGKEYTFKSTIWKGSLHEVNKDNGVRVINLDA
jgi:hypothetical protein